MPLSTFKVSLVPVLVHTISGLGTPLAVQGMNRSSPLLTWYLSSGGRISLDFSFLGTLTALTFKVMTLGECLISLVMWLLTTHV